MYLLPGDRITDPSESAGRCAQDRRITDLRFTAAELGDGRGHVALQTYTMLEPTASGTCYALNNRTIAVVDIVEAKAREQRMVTVDAGEMAKSITATGRVALYGIYFDFNKAEVKPESDTTLAEVAKLLQTTPAMSLCWWSGTPTTSAPSTSTWTSRSAGRLPWSRRSPLASR
jgi:hypothetical protein